MASEHKNIGPVHHRKITQIVAIPTGTGGLVALCDDGTLWERSDLTGMWAQVDISMIEKAVPLPVIPATSGAVGAATPHPH
jgi:hypothetical protein